MPNKNYVADNEKRCPTCKVIKPLISFDKNRYQIKGVQPYCKSCRRPYARAYYLKRKDYINKRNSKYRIFMRFQLIQKLGGKCIECGNNNPFHLQLDHVLNDGADERREYKATGTNRKMLLDYLKGKKDISNLQVLCANCNYEKSLKMYKYYMEFIKEIEVLGK